MGDVMRPIPFEELVDRMFSEFRRSSSIFGIHEDQWHKVGDGRQAHVFKQACALPLGPAAGPHTQLAQNIVAAYLCGARFFELKTVQKLDELEIAKPCIDARDEAYNVEWSSEFTLPKAFAEYVKAYVLLHVLETLTSKGKKTKPSFIFNMSVGYDLAGIKTAKMQEYIDSMLDASQHPVFNECLDNLKVLIAEEAFLEGTTWENQYGKLAALCETISPVISPSVTISTMHGCPPKEIEAICTYMMAEKRLDTFVKLNPTLLGYDAVRSILDDLGYGYIQLNPETFSHDLHYHDAVAMLRRLQTLAARHSRGFGIKLTNTLGSVNDQGVLPGAEMYMSGRALFPLSVETAYRLSKEFEGRLPVSFSGGVNALNAASLFETGIQPVTIATDMLKPGGYTRLSQIAKIIEKAEDGWNRKAIDLVKLGALADESKQMASVRKDFKQEGEAKFHQPLPMVDCYVAPCVQACPIHQDVPDYIYLVGKGQYADALELIYDKNPLPNITGWICDHQCQYHCTRLDYEGTVQIRSMKLIAAEQGFEAYLKRWEKPEATSVKAAVVGAGPAGLSAAYFLARAGFATEVFERDQRAGGVVRNVIPAFRFPESAIQADVDFIERHGVRFNFGIEQSQVSVQALHAAGFNYVFYAIGSEVDNELGLPAGKTKIIPSLEFLRDARRDNRCDLGASVVVVGGGNTAMDAARAAKRCAGVRQVTVVYRRSELEMPADREEYRNAVDDGVVFRFLANPESFGQNGNLVCRTMVLGEPDASGRRRPLPSDETFELAADTIVTAIGEKVDPVSIVGFGLPVDTRQRPIVDPVTLATPVEGVYVIGDAHSGPSTVVRCIASARTAVEAAIDIELGHNEHDHDSGCTCADHDHDGHECTCPEHEHEEDEEELDDEALTAIEAQENEFFAEVRHKKSHLSLPASTRLKQVQFAKHEAKRCLDCSYICNKCVDVCPNRANVAIDVRHRSDLFEHPFQIVHLDALCNECGNCATFCPWDGKPYRDKLTVFNMKVDFDDSQNDGFFVDGDVILARFAKHVTECTIGRDGVIDGNLPPEILAIIEEIVSVHPYLLGRVEW